MCHLRHGVGSAVGGVCAAPDPLCGGTEVPVRVHLAFPVGSATGSWGIPSSAWGAGVLWGKKEYPVGVCEMENTRSRV